MHSAVLLVGKMGGRNAPLKASPTTLPTSLLPAFGPFLFQSEIDLGELRLPLRDEGSVVRIRLGAVSPGPDEKALGNGVSASAARCTLEVPRLANFQVTAGRDVVVELAEGAAMTDVRGYLTGWVFGALCHQVGLLPLHSSAIAYGLRATAFLADSGVGKSTLAAFCERRGASVLSDDICLLEPAGGKRMQIVPVASWLKLWRGSLEQLGEEPEEANRTFSDEDKFRRYLEPVSAPGIEVRHLVFLERGGAAPALEAIGTAEAMARMLRNVYLGYLLAPMGRTAAAFALCARVLAQAEAHVLTAPWGWEAVEATLDLLEELK